MRKRLFALLLAMGVLLSLLPAAVSAEGSDLGMRKLNGESYTQMTTSQAMVDMIKDMEGFRAEPYWDVSQWSIGYGSSCGTDKNNKPDLKLTEEEAEKMLVDSLADNYGKTVNNFCSSIGRQPSQQQFDALVDFTYNLGGSWTSGCALADWLKNPASEMDFVNAIGRWGRIGVKPDYSICMRRVRDAIVFLHGEYYLAHGNGNFQSDLTVISNHNLPYYKLVIFQAGHGSFGDLSEEIQYYAVGETYGSFSTPTWEGHTLTGWTVISENNSAPDAEYPLTADRVVEKNLKVSAVWVEGTEVTDPTNPPETDPTGSTEPPETDPTVPTQDPEPTTPDNDDFPFKDVAKNAWYRKPVEFVYEKGYMAGMSATSFGPQNSLTRGMLVTVLYRIDGSPEASDADCAYFSDTQGKYYTKAVGWAKGNGIVGGISATEFGPERKITRQDAVTIFYRYCVDYLGMDGTALADLSGFVDESRVAAYAHDAVSWAVNVGLLSGAPSGGGMALNPQGNLTRAEAATMIRALVTLMSESV